MKDFPVFTTEFGVASLILKEIPYRKESYIQMQSTETPEELLKECISFCRACGAEKIYAAGHPILERFPIHTAIIEMKGEISFCSDKLPNMFPVTEKNISEWRLIYNAKMRSVDNASTLEQKDDLRILQSAGAYFIHQNGCPLGIGMLEDDHISAIAALKPGAGELICQCLQSLIPQRTMSLDVATSNKKALRLYERLGFIKTSEKNRWYRVY